MAEITGTSGPVTKIDVLGGVPGAAGVSVTTAELDADGHLIIGKSNGVTLDVGQVKFDVTPEVQAAWDGAVAAETEATTQAGIATTMAGQTTALQDGAVKSLIADEDSDTRTELNATIAGATRPLRTAPLKRSFVALGDSQIKAGDGTTGVSPETKTLMSSPQFWMSGLAEGRIEYIANSGLAGNTLAQCLERFDTDVTPLSPGIVLVRAGSNDMSEATTPAEAVSTLAQIVEKVRQIGAIPMTDNLMPLEVVTDEGRTKRQTLSALIKQWSDENGVLCADSYKVFVDPETGGWADSSDHVDGIHLSTKGQKKLGEHLSGIISEWSVEERNAVTAVDGLNVIPNPLLKDSDTDGLADDLTLSGSAKGTVTTSIQADPGIVGNLQRIALTATAANQGATYRMTELSPSALSWNAGDVIRMSCIGRLVRTSGDVRGIMTLRNFGPVSGSYDTSRIIKGVDDSGFLQIDIRTTVRTGDTVIGPRFQIAVYDGTGEAYFEFGQVRLVNLTQIGLS